MTFNMAQYPRVILVILCSYTLPLLSLKESVETIRKFSKKELLGQINPASHSAFSEIPRHLCNRYGLYLRTEVLEAFLDLEKNAIDEGVNLKIISSTRSFNHQKRIWNGKWQQTKYMGWREIEKAKDILKYSSMPGTSRHHWGTDIDLNSLENEYFESGEGMNVYDFLERCGNELGFYQVYTNKTNGRTGYEEEKWHWSYMPISSIMLQEYNKIISSSDISDFDGSNLASTINIIPNYVNGIEK
tara:strand:- start:406 stop:1137 length:732 start_codon:yes stop_codon:yes gene_type:complete